MTKFIPLEDRVLILPDDKDTVSAGGIHLVQTAQSAPTKGRVLATGPGAIGISGTREPTGVEAGDRVLFSKYGGNEAIIDGVTYMVVPAGQLYGKLVTVDE